MRVLQVVPSLASRTGGPAFVVVESSLALRQCGVETTVFATDMGGAASAKIRRRVSLSDLPAGAEELDIRLFPARWPYPIAFSPALYRALAREVPRYDVLHIHSLFIFPQFAAYRQAIRHGIPYIVAPHGALDPYLRRHGWLRKAVVHVLWQRDMLNRASALHLTSEEEARLVADVAPAVPRVVVSNGIRCAEYSELPSGSEFRRRYLGGDDGPLVMNIGRLSYKKGLDILIRAFAILSKDVPGCWLAIVGPDDEGLTPQLQALAEREGIASRVVFTGMLRGDDKLAALASADVWALPSHTENFGIAVAEALAAGRAVVVSPGVNIAPDIAAASAGVVADLTAEAFAASIVSLLRDAAGRARLGATAREFARRYDWAAIGRRLAEMYATAAAGRGREA
jgi:glycosyltransferase involved in cell wall biosynthesis